MPVDIKAEITNYKEVQARMTAIVKGLRGEPLLNGMRRSVLIVQREAKIEAPVDTGRLRASIVPEVTRRGNTVVGIVGSNVEYAPYMELGTRPHWPPPGALEVWARRHHMSEFAIRRKIAMYGTEGRHYLRGAFEKSREQIVQLIGKVVASVIRG